MKYITGVGSRDIPQDVYDYIVGISKELAKRGYCLRSGSAEGADDAFEKGWSEVDGNTQFWIPWNGFGFKRSGVNYHLPTQAMFTQAYTHLEGEFISWIGNMKQGAQKLHCRNYFQIHGNEGEFKSVVCLYASVDGKDGIPKGGTRTAVMLAREAEIPCYNLLLESDREKLDNLIN